MYNRIKLYISAWMLCVWECSRPSCFCFTWCCFSVPAPHLKPCTATWPSGSTWHLGPLAGSSWSPRGMVHFACKGFSMQKKKEINEKEGGLQTKTKDNRAALIHLQGKQSHLYLTPKFPNHFAIVRVPPVRQHLMGGVRNRLESLSALSVSLPKSSLWEPTALKPPCIPTKLS